jgi:NAD(P)H-dependent FMN reductase
MAYLIISTSLHPTSKSRLLAREMQGLLEKRGVDVQWLDLAETSLPLCDGASCYGEPNVQLVGDLIKNAEGILIATPIYNYSCSASAKNLIELTGKNWSGKVVSFLCAAGGAGSYMSIMGLANHLMLDFRSIIVPRFVYAQPKDFDGDAIAPDFACERLDELAKALIRFGTALND